MATELTKKTRWLTFLRYVVGLGLGIAAEWVARLLSFLGHAVRNSVSFLKLAVEVEFKSLPAGGHALTHDAMRDIGLAFVAILVFGAMAIALAVVIEKILKGTAQRAVLLLSILLSGFFFVEGPN